MQNVSQEYRDIVAGNHWFENRLCIGDTGKLIDKAEAQSRSAECAFW